VTQLDAPRLALRRLIERLMRCQRYGFSEAGETCLGVIHGAEGAEMRTEPRHCSAMGWQIASAKAIQIPYSVFMVTQTGIRMALIHVCH
jgi:hypothetical protein